jgi:beta-glucanase (GH16 family)
MPDNNGPVSWQPGSWAIVWRDEFDGPAGVAPDATKWTHELGGWGWGNKELQNYTDSTSNAALDGAGNLVITARAEASGGNNYSSARLTTKGLFARAYGRFEARMRLAHGRGLWPAFWIMGDDIDAVGWPSCGEMDIVEEKGGVPGSVAASVHGPQKLAAIDVPATRYLDLASGSDVDVHVYAVEWDPDNIVFLVDDTPYLRITPAQRPRWVYDHPFFILVNLAVGGLFPGSPDSTTMLPQSIAIDYVRVSARQGDGGADGGDAGAEDAPLDADAGAEDAPLAADAGADDVSSPRTGGE